jgi:hypothetical protein
MYLFVRRESQAHEKHEKLGTSRVTALKCRVVLTKHVAEE